MKRFLIHGVRVVCAALITLVITFFPFWKWESALYDLRVRLSPKEKPDPAIVLIGIDDKTLDAFEGKWPLPSNAYIALLERLKSATPFSTAFLFPLHRESEWTERDLQGLAQVTSGSQNLFHAVKLIPTGADYPEKRLPNITPMLSFTLIDSQHFAKDRVSRRGALWFHSDRFTEYSLANLYFGKDLAQDRTFMKKTKDVDGGQTFLTRYAGTKGTFPILSFIDVLNGKIDESWLKNKIILIGPTYGNESQNVVDTPFSRTFTGMSRLEVQANVLQTLLHKNPVRQASPWVDLFLTFAVALLTIFILFSIPPIRGLLFLLAEALIISLSIYLCYAALNVWINFIHPFLTVFVCYYFFLPYRLIVEDRRRWKYQKKSELLGQVEELKTNFMSLISHDLKTPIARIQGMAERALNDPHPLSPDQRDSVSSIIRNSEELGSFISNILDLTRIETKNVRLRKTTKDLNEVIQECLRSTEDLAKGKNIKIITELDPLFSIKFDVSLIKQAITNILENALKYSPYGATVTIRSQEVDNQIKFLVQDSGPGLSELDKENLFSKFYRGKNEQTAKVKGTGLGLYLVKYFIELHKGSVHVDSNPGKGTTFWFTLPIEG